MSKFKFIVRIILVVLGAVMIALSAETLMGAPELAKVLDMAVYLDEPVILPENEGKIVMIYGEVEMTAPAYDEELGLTLQTVKAYRYDEAYEQTGHTDENREWKWVGKGQKTIVGEASIGEFALDEKTLGALSSEGYYSEFDMSEIEKNGYVLDTGDTDLLDVDQTYVLIDADWHYQGMSYSATDNWRERSHAREYADEREGARAAYYRFYDPETHGVVTVAGIQQGDQLVTVEDSGAIVLEGKMTKEDFINTTKALMTGGAVFFLILGVVLVLLGVRRGKSKSAGKRGKTSKPANKRDADED